MASEPVTLFEVGADGSTRTLRKADKTAEASLVDSEAIITALMKASQHIVPSFYDAEEVYIEAKKNEDVTDTDVIRRAIHTISNYYNTLGVYRDDFDRSNNDKLARNAYYSICEKAIMDYMGAVQFTVKDRDNQRVEKAIEFLDAPNPQEGWEHLIKPSIRDLVRYDAGCWVKSFKKSGYIGELKAYNGTEFWKEIDRVPMIINIPLTSTIKYINTKSYGQPAYQGWWSHGFTERFWQRSRTGVYIPYQPEEVCYFMMYPRTDGVYGTDFLKFLKYQLQYLIDSTKAAGKTFENGVVPSLVWMHPEVRNIQQLNERIRQLQTDSKGSYRFGSVLHTVAGEKVETVSSTLHEMEWLEGQKFVAQLIWAMWGFSPTEFVGEGEGRATAYIKRNVTKSRLLYPLMDYFEKKINREILPFMRDYRRGWRFQFIRDVDLDDEQKIATTRSIRAQTVGQYMNLGFRPSTAMKLAGIEESLTPEEMDEVDEEVEELMTPEAGLEGDVTDGDGPVGELSGEEPGNLPEGEVEMGRYQGEGQNYVQFQLSNDYGLTEEGKVPKESPGKVQKAKVYIMHPSEAPRGRTVRRGSRGGYYYITTEREKKKYEPGPAGRKGKAGRRGHKGWEEGAAEPEEPKLPPTPPDTTGAITSVRVSGKGVGLVVAAYKTGIKAHKINNDATNAFIKHIADCMRKVSDEGKVECIAAKAKEMGLEVELTD